MEGKTRFGGLSFRRRIRRLDFGASVISPQHKFLATPMLANVVFLNKIVVKLN